MDVASAPEAFPGDSLVSLDEQPVTAPKRAQTNAVALILKARVCIDVPPATPIHLYAVRLRPFIRFQSTDV